MTECDIRSWIRVNNNAWAEHNNTVLTSAKVKSPRWKPVVEGHVKLITMHILVGMEDMAFYSLDELNRVLMVKVDAENQRPFERLTYSRYNLLINEEKETLLPLPSSRFEYLERSDFEEAVQRVTVERIHANYIESFFQK